MPNPERGFIEKALDVEWKVAAGVALIAGFLSKIDVATSFAIAAFVGYFAKNEFFSKKPTPQPN